MLAEPTESDFDTSAWRHRASRIAPRAITPRANDPA
jgi:hypothetical protein